MFLLAVWVVVDRLVILADKIFVTKVAMIVVGFAIERGPKNFEELGDNGKRRSLVGILPPACFEEVPNF
jgi:hypothetical protein